MYNIVTCGIGHVLLSADLTDSSSFQRAQFWVKELQNCEEVCVFLHHFWNFLILLLVFMLVWIQNGNGNGNLLSKHLSSYLDGFCNIFFLFKLSSFEAL